MYIVVGWDADTERWIVREAQSIDLALHKALDLRQSGWLYVHVARAISTRLVLIANE